MSVSAGSDDNLRDNGSASDNEPVEQTPPRKGKKRDLDLEKSGQKPPAPPRTKGGKASPKKPGSRVGRHAVAKTAKGKQKCRACQKVLDANMFSINQVNCGKCKKALDVLSKKAKAQNKVSWFKKVKSDPARLKALVNAYSAAVEDAKKAGNKKTTFCISTFIESQKASSKVRSNELGQLMWEDQAIEFFQTTAGGSLTKAKAKIEWDSRVANVDDDTLTDQKGPQHSALRIWVKTGDMVSFENTYGRSKHLDCTFLQSSSCAGAFMIQHVVRWSVYDPT